ncbi:pR27 [rat cytomegalovirus strain Maastricht]|uniref:PR27 n=1 Tax=Rat cytomegalovirus (strain Maastricht) TaxID=79700 RepID=Q9DWG2_RCMVM|nr:pR27 [rat cytomegalovirus strain Maastricht]AAF99127.1 pR27 [rat cytomegalovirus strain Maastricht]
MDSWSKRNGKAPREITRFLSVDEPFDHVELKISYLKNARFATANGHYGIIGLALRWDTAVWGLLREIECVPYSNPFVFPNCARLSGIIAAMQFRPEANEVVRALCRACVAAQYGVSILFSYDHCAAVPRYLRSLVQELVELNDRIRHLSIVSNLRVEAEDLGVIQGVLPERVAALLGVPAAHELFLSDEYYDCVEAAVDAMFDRFCECAECGMRRSERIVAVRARALGDARGLTARRGMLRKKRRNRFFEENDVALPFCPELGRLRLPRIRHLDLVQQELLCRHIGRDLMFDSMFGVCRGMSRMRGVPIPFCSAEKLNLDLAYVLYLASNSYFLCFLIRTVRDVMRHEERAYGELCLGLARDAARALREDVEARVAAGAVPPRRTYFDFLDPGLSAEEKDLSIVGALERVTFRGCRVVERRDPDGTSVDERVGCFRQDAAVVLGAAAAYHVPRALREHRAREELLAHTLGIRRLYDERVLAEFHGEKLVPYHLCVGGHWRRDGWAVQARNVTLLDEEIVGVRGDDMFAGHVDFYERFEEVEVIREIPVKKRTFMMELQRMYVSKSELAAYADADVEIEEAADEDDGREVEFGPAGRDRREEGIRLEDYDDSDLGLDADHDPMFGIVDGDDDDDDGDDDDGGDDAMSGDEEDDEDADEGPRYVVERLEGYRT